MTTYASFSDPGGGQSSSHLRAVIDSIAHGHVSNSHARKGDPETCMLHLDCASQETKARGSQDTDSFSTAVAAPHWP
ncbi:hypothetical protein J1614_005579 [Plenodomus biglobosus]|nr:hypothetical protein J1614_005579 [Plenodomus biglobosus]